jgi:hypothetical protein
MKIDFEKYGPVYIRADAIASFCRSFILTTSTVHFYSCWSDISVELKAFENTTVHVYRQNNTL